MLPVQQHLPDSQAETAWVAGLPPGLAQTHIGAGRGLCWRNSSSKPCQELPPQGAYPLARHTHDLVPWPQHSIQGCRYGMSARNKLDAGEGSLCAHGCGVDLLQAQGRRQSAAPTSHEDSVPSRHHLGASYATWHRSSEPLALQCSRTQCRWRVTSSSASRPRSPWP